MIVGHQSQKDDEADEKIGETRHHCGGGNNQPGKVDLADQAGVADQTVGGFAQRIREKVPGKHSRKDHKGVRSVAVTWQLGHPAKDYCEHHHGQKRSQDRPANPDDGLLVAHGDVPPGQN